MFSVLSKSANKKRFGDCRQNFVKIFSVSRGLIYF